MEETLEYANMRLKFSCDNARKAPTTAAIAPIQPNTTMIGICVLTVPIPKIQKEMRTRAYKGTFVTIEAMSGLEASGAWV